MPSEWSKGLCALTMALASGCGGDGKQELGEAPEPFSRELPEVGGGDRDGGTRPLLDANVEFQFDAGACCSVPFSIPESEDGELFVVLRGTAAPLDGAEGYPLTLKDGTWSTDACVPLEYSGFYYYEFALPPQLADGGVDPAGGAPYMDTRYNLDEPVGDDPLLGTVNVFGSRETCE